MLQFNIRNHMTYTQIHHVDKEQHNLKAFMLFPEWIYSSWSQNTIIVFLKDCKFCKLAYEDFCNELYIRYINSKINVERNRFWDIPLLWKLFISLTFDNNHTWFIDKGIMTKYFDCLHELRNKLSHLLYKYVT